MSVVGVVHRHNSWPRSSLRRDCFNGAVDGAAVLRDDRGWTPLHVAARMGDLEEVQRLLDAGADVNAPSWGPKAPGTTPLHLASTGGHLLVMDLLLDRGANIEARTKGGCGWSWGVSLTICPLLHYRNCYWGRIRNELKELLFRVHVISFPGTPLHNAAKERNKRAVRFLLENGAFLSPDMTDTRFNPPLHYCPGLEWAYKMRGKTLKPTENL